MPNAFVAKLCGHGLLPSEDMSLLVSVCGTQRDVPARQDLIREGDEPGPVFVILKGWACRYKLLPEGTRQITSFLMPGDCGDLHASVSHRMEHSIATLTSARVAKVDRKEMEELIETRPAIMRAKHVQGQRGRLDDDWCEASESHQGDIARAAGLPDGGIMDGDCGESDGEQNVNHVAHWLPFHGPAAP